MARFEAAEPNGVAVQQMEVLVRTAIYKPANALVGFLLQGAADVSRRKHPANAGLPERVSIPREIRADSGLRVCLFGEWRRVWNNQVSGWCSGRSARRRRTGL